MMRVKLEQLAAGIFTGQIMSRVAYKEDESGPTDGKVEKVLVPSAISGGVVVHTNLGSAVLKREIDKNRLTEDGDIVIKLSSPYDCALITGEDTGLIVPSFCALIKKVDSAVVYPAYLVGVLNSQVTQSRLIAGINSSAMAMVRQKSLVELEITLPDYAHQKTVGKAYWASCRKKAKLQEMVAYQQRVSDAIMLASIVEVARHES